MPVWSKLKARFASLRRPTFREVLGWIARLPLRLLKFIIKLPVNLVKFIIFLPRNIWRAWTAGARGIVKLEEWAVIAWGHLKEARRQQRLHLPRARLTRWLYRTFHPRRGWHGIRARIDPLRRAAWDSAPDLGNIPKSIKWARQQHRHRSRFTDIDALRSILYTDTTPLEEDPLHPTVGMLARHSSITRRQGGFLHGLVRFYGAQRVLALGTGYGIANLYLARGLVDNYPMRTCMLIVLEAERDRARYAENQLQRLGYTDFAEVRQGEIQKTLEKALEDAKPLNLALIHGSPTEDDLLRYVAQIKRQTRPGTPIIITGIRDNRAMGRAWATVRAMPQLAAAIDLWTWGIVITGKGPAVHLSARL
ncbi:MAG: class I SAM-dependent methyltransferase [Anaerolineae bacterium]|nr:class I SAM-dependent methyltransferase [Anaerolineae bacterium]